ncbi:MAG TPA: GNAT family N-acetyltransferase [Candidatus Pacearchaeota archaeon]|nr:GNAT family N-acetyltransferase [Candidatus Pacearchaeota archaeon]HDZ60846.1 GNAT family N-acetyltransferase [Candidatus Pacearchaeota archaeon]
MKMEIRKASIKNLKKVSELMMEEFSKPPFNEKPNSKNVLKSLKFYNKIGEIYIATDKKEVVGVIVFKIEQFWEGPVILIEDLAVKENCQKQGIGKKLMDYIEHYAKNKKVKYIFFTTHKKSSSVKFYQKRGYKVSKKTIFMRKKLK